MRERPVVFQSGKEQLHGILSLPDAAPAQGRDEAGIVLVGTIRGRCGANRQYERYARAFANAGIPAFRFDNACLGDSTGKLDPIDHRIFYTRGQNGEYVNDLLSAVQAFRKEANPRRLILMGLCGGALTALLANAVLSPPADDIVLLAVPVLFERFDGYVPTHAARAIDIPRNTYWDKVWSPEAWARLLTGQSRMDVIAACGKSTLHTAWIKASKRLSFSTDSDLHPRFNRHFLRALDANVSRKTRLLFIFGLTDPLRSDFENQFKTIFWSSNPAYEACSEIQYIPGCNHSFTRREWQDEVIRLSLYFIGSCLPKAA